MKDEQNNLISVESGQATAVATNGVTSVGTRISPPINVEEESKFKKFIKSEKTSGYLFLLPWLLGFFVLVAFPIVRTLIFSFSQVRLGPGTIDTTFKGFSNYVYALVTDTAFLDALKEYAMEIVLYVPVITVVSLCLAMLLNSKLKGTGLFRTIFFLPVIITSGPVIEMFIDQGVASFPGIEELINFEQLNLPEILVSALTFLTSEFIMILWFSGIQILIFMTGLQKMDKSMYEAAKIDGATKWEMFWKITLPALNPTIVLNVVFTVVMQSVFSLNPIINKITNAMDGTGEGKGYGYAAAMSWIYFLLMLVILGLAILIFKKHEKKLKKGKADLRRPASREAGEQAVAESARKAPKHLTDNRFKAMGFAIADVSIFVAKKIKNFFIKASKKIKNFFIKLFPTLKNFFIAFGKGFVAFCKAVGAGCVALVKGAPNFFRKLPSRLKKATIATGRFFVATGKRIGAWFYDKFVLWFKGDGEERPSVADRFDKLCEWFKKLPSRLAKFFKNLPYRIRSAPSRFMKWAKGLTKENVKSFWFGSGEKKGFLWVLLSYIALILFGFVYIYPMLYMLGYSFMSETDVVNPMVNYVPTKLYFQNFVDAFKVLDFGSTLMQTIVISVIPSFLQTVSCCLAAYGLARFEIPGKKLLFGLIVLTFIVPAQLTMLPQIRIYTSLGIMNSKVLPSIFTFIIPAMLGQGIKSAVFILIFYQFFKGIPDSVIEAAKIDGAGSMQIFLRLGIPAALPAIFLSFLLSVVWYYNETVLSAIYFGSDFTTLPLELSKFQASYNNIIGNASGKNANEAIYMAGTFLSILPLLVFYFFTQKKFTDGIDKAGITGE